MSSNILSFVKIVFDQLSFNIHYYLLKFSGYIIQYVYINNCNHILQYAMTYELGQRCLHNNNKNCSKALILLLIRLVFTFKIKDESFQNNYDNNDR